MALAVVKRAWPAALCLLGVAATYGLVSNFLTLIGTIFAERLMYLPSAFFLVLVGIGAARVPRRVVAPALAVLLALASVRTFTYARRWNDRLAFYDVSRREQPESIQLYLLTSMEAKERGRLDLAEEVIAEARRRAPDHWLVYNYSALIALDRGELDRADEYVARSMSLSANLQAGYISELIAKERQKAEGRRQKEDK
jgi:hypothetical protein